MRIPHAITWVIRLACLLPAGVLHPQTPNEPVTTDLVVSARAVEEPLLKHRLFPAEYELRDGDAAPILLRLAWEQLYYFSKVVPTFEELLRLPLDDPKLVEAGTVLKQVFYEEMRRAAHRRTASWEYPIGEQPHVSILLPDLQGARDVVGRGLSVWIRHHIAKGELDRAEEAIRVGFAVNRHYGRTPFVVTQLVTVVLNSFMLERLEELISQPESANYYWALSALPRPLVDLRPALEFETYNLEQSAGLLDRLAESRSAEEWMNLDRRVFALYFRDYSGVKPLTDEDRQSVRRRAVERARKELPGWWPGGAASAAAMTESELIVRWLVEQHRRQGEEINATMSLEAPAALPALRSLHHRIEAFRMDIGFGYLLFAETPLNLYVKCHALQRRVDALRAVEAIRNYAATHAGKLPQSLDQIVETPIPADVLTGKPFHYELADGAAIVSAAGIPVPGGYQGGIRYRIVLRGAKAAGAVK